MVFKVDFAKAYDSVRWDFLDDVLRSFGFGSKWRSWISRCLSSAMASVIVNESPTSEFHVQCGLKQGDPLAPYLFILVMKSLHLSFSRVIDAGEWSDSNLDCILQALQCFYFASGLKINVQKSNMMGVGINPHVIAEAASKLGCSILNPHFKYLGVTVGTSMSKVSILRNVHSLNARGIDLVSHCKKHVGDGLNTSFWHDNWINGLPLKQKFSRVYALESNKLCMVADKRLAIDLDLSFHRSIRGGVESQQYSQLHALIRSFIFSNSKTDGFGILTEVELGDEMFGQGRSRVRVPPGTFNPSREIGGSTGGFMVQYTVQLDVTAGPEPLTTNKPLK
uniref:RNA-directed DNA polymerase, eukaryota n=1 Tax=Tanacetum cinerariifolium TaxID=118510 RepID=A0A6L2NZV7_TANCI|nr:RNA-directed DNA polymerase, eukaryota [Tanacetum cinerariifolium]